MVKSLAPFLFYLFFLKGDIMAIIKVSNADEVVTEFQYEIYGEKKEKVRPHNGYKIDNGILNQTIHMEAMICKNHKVFFPITFFEKCNGVFVDKCNIPELQKYIHIHDISNSGFLITIDPNEYLGTDFVIIATGY